MAWLEDRARSDPEYYRAEIGTFSDTPRSKPPGRVAIARHALIGSPHAWVGVGIVQATDSAEALARLRFGGWNECPPTAVHQALLAGWQGRFGVMLAGVTFDTLEVTVAQPPTDEVEATALARTHFLYCPDLVHQGTETLGALASSLVGSTVWTFWWD